MAKKDKEDSYRFIPLNERNPDLEADVQYWLSITPDLPLNDKKILRPKDPDTLDPRELQLRRREEIRRIKEGHFGMSGKYYFWYNYVKMVDVEKGLIRPEFRMAQVEWFDQIDKAQKSKEFGLICVKRRRVGASWMEAADVLHDCITTPFFRAGMTSKTQVDAVELFKKVKFIYDNLPDWLRPTSSAGNTQTSIDFSWWDKDPKGNRVKRGTQSEIIVKPPTETSWEGHALRKLVIDEGGKVAALKSIFSLANDTMMVGSRRVGCPVIFGTAGDIGKEGKDLMDMWYNADIHKLNQFFYAGYMGLSGFVDEFGNDMKEDAIRWIIYERKRIEGLSMKEYTTFIQKYPLSVEEAFKANHEVGIGNRIKIQKQRDSLLKNPPIVKHGWFHLDKDQNVTFVPDRRGACKIYEDPIPNYRALYCAGLDPVDHDVQNVRDASSLSMFIMKKHDGLQPPKIVFEYTDRPNVARDAYEQSLMALLYYNKTKVLVEKNRFGIITYFEDRGYKYLLQTAPQGMSRLIAGNTFNIGFHMSKTTKKYIEELVEEYIEDYCEYIPALELLKEFDQYGLVNTDRVVAMGATLMFLKEDKTVSREAGELKKTIPDWNFRRVGGKLKIIR